MILVPDFYKNFKCIADRCSDSCCIGWEIDVDCGTLQKYRAMGDGERILSRIELDAEPPYIKLSEGDSCPFLDGRGLCTLITKYGEEYIPEICKRHPRYYNEILDFTECSVGLSCKEAAEIILAIREKPKMEKMEEASTSLNETTEKEERCPTNEENVIKILYKTRDKLFDFAFDKRGDTIGVVSGILRYQTAVSDYLFDGTAPGEIESGEAEELYSLIDALPEAFARLELLSEELRALGALSSREKMLSLLAEHSDTSRALLYYFLHRYMLSGASDFDLDDRLTLCVLLLFICLAFLEGNDAVDGAVLFSKNVEYSTENIEILLDIIAERG